MWKSIENILTSGNGIAIAVLLVILVILAILCAKLGLIKIHTDKVSVGNDASEEERAIVRNQIEWVKLASKAFENKIPRYENYDVYRGKYIIEQVLDEMINWIVFNHIEDKRTYISIKQELVWNIVQAHIENDIMRTDEFRRNVNDYVEYVIKNLVAIRGEYKKTHY